MQKVAGKIWGHTRDFKNGINRCLAWRFAVLLGQNKGLSDETLNRSTVYQYILTKQVKEPRKIGYCILGFIRIRLCFSSHVLYCLIYVSKKTLNHNSIQLVQQIEFDAYFYLVYYRNITSRYVFIGGLFSDAWSSE